MRRKLNDFDRFNNIQRTLSEHNATLENELKKLKLKLVLVDDILINVYYNFVQLLD